MKKCCLELHIWWNDKQISFLIFFPTFSFFCENHCVNLISDRELNIVFKNNYIHYHYTHCMPGDY